jgi:plastocyanin
MKGWKLLGLLAVVSVALVACRQEVQQEPAEEPQEQPQPAPPQEATISFDGTAFSIEPTNLEAAPAVITFQNDGERPASGFLAQFLPGKGPEDLAQVKSEEEFFSLIVPSGTTPETAPGESSEVTISLPEGSYAVVGEGQEQPATFQVVAATKEFQSPEADLQMDAGEFFFKLSTAEIPSGPVTIEVSNVGAQGHEVVIQKQGAKDESQEGAFALAPAPGGRLWLEADLSPGTYDVVCFFPDPNTGQQHVDLGMKAELKVT